MRGGVAEEAGHAEDAVHGRANFVAHGGQEHGFGFAGAVGGDTELAHVPGDGGGEEEEKEEDGGEDG